MRFTEFEALGPSLVAMSRKVDGDWSTDYLQTYGFTGHLPGAPREIVLLRQVHRAGLVNAEQAQRIKTDARLDPELLPEGDAIVTATPRLTIAVRVADCVPIFFFEPEKRVGAIAHAGRESTYHGIASKVIALMEERHRAAPGRIHALLGPSAGPCCYEVSTEMVKQFSQKGLSHKGRNLDLWESNIIQITAAGVPRAQITTSGICTICDGQFHSYRASGGKKLNNIALLSL